MEFTMSSMYLLQLIVLLSFYYVYRRCRAFLDYFDVRGIPHLKPRLIFGNIGPVLLKQRPYFKIIEESYNVDRDSQFFGVYNLWRPTIYIKDAELLTRILKTDWESFSHRGFYYDAENDPLSANLFNMSGQDWKDTRRTLSPVFTSGKLKGMMPIIEECSTTNSKHLLGNGGTFEARTHLSKFSLDVVARTCFGVDPGAYTEQKTLISSMITSVFSLNSLRALSIFARLFQPKVANALRLKIVRPDVEKFFLGLVSDTIRQRKESGARGNDFIQLMADLQDTLPENKIAAQCFIFLVAGYESTSTSLSFILYFLASHPEVQEKLRSQVLGVTRGHGGAMTYDALKEMDYLEAVINESLRLYPPVTGTVRVCTKTYRIPDTDILIEEGDMVGIPIHALQRDPRYFARPQLFEPERWLRGNEPPRPSTFIPFGDGPRICIAVRFAMLVMKSLVAQLVSEYNFKLNEKTSDPLTFNPNSLLLVTESGIWIDYKRL